MSYNYNFINCRCAIAVNFAAHEVSQNVYRLVLGLRKVMLTNNFERNGYK
jgi:hypothetical protein